MSLVEEYLNAKAEYEEAKLRVNSLGSMLSEMGRLLLTKPDRVAFSNAKVGLPPDIALAGTTRKFDASQWPSAEVIQTEIGNLYSLKHKVLTAWNAVPAAQQGGLKPPSP